MSEIKNFNSLSLSANEWNLKTGCVISFYDEDDEGNESNNLYIHLTYDQAVSLRKMLSSFDVKENTVFDDKKSVITTEKVLGKRGNIMSELRLCEVNAEIGYFHCWEHWSNIVDASPMIGGHPGGTVSAVYGIVEFSDGVRRVDPTDICFCDEKGSALAVLNYKSKD